MGILNIINKFISYSKYDDITLAEKIFDTLPYGEYVSKVKDQQIKSAVAGCVSRQDTLNKVIELCGDLSTPRQRFLCAQAYAWSTAPYRTEAIKHMKLYLENELYATAYMQLASPVLGKKATLQQSKNIHIAMYLGYLGHAYEGNYDLDNALKCYIEAKKLTPFYPSPYCSISNIYIKMNKLDKALETCNNVKESKYYKLDEDFREVIDREIDNITKKIDKGYIYKAKKSHQN